MELDVHKTELDIRTMEQDVRTPEQDARNMENTDLIQLENLTGTTPRPLPIEMLRLRNVMRLGVVSLESLTDATPHRPLKPHSFTFSRLRM